MVNKKSYLVLFCSIIAHLNSVGFRMAIESPLTRELSKVFNTTVAVTSWTTATNTITYLSFGMYHFLPLYVSMYLPRYLEAQLAIYQFAYEAFCSRTSLVILRLKHQNDFNQWQQIRFRSCLSFRYQYYCRKASYHGWKVAFLIAKLSC